MCCIYYFKITLLYNNCRINTVEQQRQKPILQYFEIVFKHILNGYVSFQFLSKLPKKMLKTRRLI